MVSTAQKTSSDEPQDDGGRRLATLISLSHIINLEADLFKPVLLHPENCKLLETLEKIPPRTQHHRASDPMVGANCRGIVTSDVLNVRT